MKFTGLDNPHELLLRQGSDISGDSRIMNEWDSKQLLASYGLPLLKGQCLELNELTSAADAIGYPVVIKGVSDQLTHKTEVGAVALNLLDSDALSVAAKAMASNLHDNGIKGVRYLIEPMVSDSVGELIIGLKRDSQFGLALIIAVVAFWLI